MLIYVIFTVKKKTCFMYSVQKLEGFLPGNKKTYYNQFDSTMDYTLPSVGDEVCIYGAYSGFSTKFDMAAAIFGLDKFIYKQSFGVYSPDKYEK